MIEGVLLDIDGTLVDSNDARALSWVEALHEAGVGAALPDLRLWIGMGEDQMLVKLGIFPENGKFKTVPARAREIFRKKFLADLKVFPGALELVDRLERKGIKTAAISPSPRELLEDVLRVAGLESLLANAVASGEAAAGLPEADPLRAALKKIHVKPDKAILIGDAPDDIYAGKKIGMETIALTCGGWREEELRAALAVFRDPGHLLDSLGSTPLGHARAA